MCSTKPNCVKMRNTIISDYGKQRNLKSCIAIKVINKLFIQECQKYEENVNEIELR